MMQRLWPWANPRSRQVTCGIWCLGVLLILYQQWLPELLRNLAYSRRNHVLMAARSPTTEPYNEDLSQAIQLLAQSNELNQCNPLGFFPQAIIGCDEVAPWPKATISLTDGVSYPIFLAPSNLGSMKYGQVLSLTLSGEEFINLDSLTLLTFTAHSTRIEQGELVAYAIVITTEDTVYTMPIRAGLETADGTYDFPDIPPKHVQPSVNYARALDGKVYPVTFEFDHPVSPKIITILFVYAQRWHVEPILLLWAISPKHIDTSSQS